ncbi:hypothetical protein NDU88_004316 [Pleurodeles waltl]|uniref:Uncharacterized protein n=1 Tax=Pleurodeles waltl TaxID=8319 RepID=A0AAV7WVA9_PLEWA|nr:hypothetical protein NDU88_004316 [Pleurodeles waltl]
MPGGKSGHKPTGKPSRQLLFSEALQHKRTAPPTAGLNTAPTQPTFHDGRQRSTCNYGTDTAGDYRCQPPDRGDGFFYFLLDIGDQIHTNRHRKLPLSVTGLEHCMGIQETHMSTIQDKDQDLSYLRSKMTDLEDRSRRDNIRLPGIPENEEGPDMQAFLSSVIPKLTSISFDPLLEFQRAHRVGRKHPDGASRPR